MNIVVDWDKCDSNGVCAGIEPSVFKIADNGDLDILQEHPPAELRAKMEEAIRNCPTHAISIEND